MIKSLLPSVILFLFFQFVHSQLPPPPGISAIIECDPDLDGMATFDLTTEFPFNGVDRNDYPTISYHKTELDAELNINSISNPENYQNTSQDEDIFVRAEPIDGQNSILIGQFYLVTRFLNYDYEIANIVQCTQFAGPSCFYLPDAYYLFCGNTDPSNLDLKFYATRDDYINRTNPIQNPEAYTATSYEQTIYLYATSLISNLSEGTSFVIETIEPPILFSNIETYIISDKDNDGTETFDLDSHTSGAEILGATSYSFEYYASDADLHIGQNKIENTSAFVNTANPQTIFVKLLNIENYPGCNETEYCYDSFEFDVYAEPCIDNDNDGICDDVDSCPELNNDFIGTACDDGDPCTINDLYTEDCECVGTFEDSDGDSVCDAEDLCPGGNDLIDEDQNGIPDSCQQQCVDSTISFNSPTLSHVGNGSTATSLDFPDNSQMLSFTISGLDSKLKGKPANQYIELITVSYIDENDVYQLLGNYSGEYLQGTSIYIASTVKSLTVTIYDGQDGNSGSSEMSISLSEVMYCELAYPCLPDSDLDGVCDELDVCPDFDDRLIGTPCDDNDYCTINDTYQNNCECYGEYVDADNDSWCVGEDPDDNDPCNPDPSSENCQPCAPIIVDNFENGFGNWIDGGRDVILTNNSPLNSGYAVRLRDGAGENSSIYTDLLNLKGESGYYLNFTFYTEGFVSGDSFVIEISEDGGNTFHSLEKYSLNLDFENRAVYKTTYAFEGNLGANAVIRIGNNSSSKKSHVYLDDIALSNCLADGINSQSRLSSSHKIQHQIDLITIYPNPVKNTLYVRSSSKSELKYRIVNLVGQLIMSEDLLTAGSNVTQEIDIQSLANGIYIFELLNELGERVKQKKIVVRK